MTIQDFQPMQFSFTNLLCTGDLKNDDKSDETLITPSSNGNSNHLLQVKGTIRINCGTDITVISGQDVQVKCLSRGWKFFEIFIIRRNQRNIFDQLLNNENKKIYSHLGLI